MKSAQKKEKSIFRVFPSAVCVCEGDQERIPRKLASFPLVPFCFDAKMPIL